MKKKITMLMISLVLVLSVLGGCSSKSEETSTDGKTTIEVWAMGDEGKRLSGVVKDFEAKNPKIKLKVTAIPWDSAHDKLVTAAAAKEGPDVIQLGSSWVTEFAAAGGLLDLSKYDKSEDYPNINSDKFFTGASEGSKYDGNLYSVPWYVETRVLYYRSDLLAQVGYKEAPKTQAELKDAAEKLVKLGGKDHYGIDLAITDPMYPQVFSWQNGVDLIDSKNRKANFNDAKAISSMEYYASFFKEGLAAGPDVQIDITQAFADGIKPMYISGPWMINIMNDAKATTGEFEWNIAPLPAGDTDNTSYLGGAGLSVSAYSDNPEEALTFINYMADPEVQVNWYKTANGLPAVTSAWEDPSLADDKILSVFREQLDHAKVPPMIVELESIKQNIIKMVEDVVVGGADVKSEMKKLEQTAQEILDGK
ncbi:multiple sugar transport system substrate-binding protein [Bacillus niacini]|uniref:Multiple sugar transport system substrate-binding protein n=1 Tax=Neobacillus niacini TaxID=86668 RepID=A0A852TKN7_9BACI|nr:sugar ABC transporter substrate-binding protein [Neobacillus niacini]NYE08077.1 multiple sugar transport system substrate-binding protein [Neobacillus niacini]